MQSSVGKKVGTELPAIDRAGSVEEVISNSLSLPLMAVKLRSVPMVSTCARRLSSPFTSRRERWKKNAMMPIKKMLIGIATPAAIGRIVLLL